MPIIENCNWVKLLSPRLIKDYESYYRACDILENGNIKIPLIFKILRYIGVNISNRKMIYYDSKNMKYNVKYKLFESER